MHISLDISVFIVRFGDQAILCRVDIPTGHQNKLTTLQQKLLGYLFDELSDNNASDDGLSLSVSVAVNKQISEVILMLANKAILVVYQINACYNSYTCDCAFHHIN